MVNKQPSKHHGKKNLGWKSMSILIAYQQSGAIKIKHDADAFFFLQENVIKISKH